MIYHATTLHILYVSVVYQLDREWWPPSLGMATFVVMFVGEDDAWVSSY
jgi:hypothetical protein